MHLSARLCPIHIVSLRKTYTMPYTFSADGEAKYHEWFKEFCQQRQDRGEPVQHLKLVDKLVIAVPKSCELKRKVMTYGHDVLTSKRPEWDIFYCLPLFSGRESTRIRRHVQEQSCSRNRGQNAWYRPNMDVRCLQCSRKTSRREAIAAMSFCFAKDYVCLCFEMIIYLCELLYSLHTPFFVQCRILTL